MQPDHVSPKYITACPSCNEICSEIHPSNLRHHTIGTHVLETQIESILNQNYDQWLELFQKLQTSIHILIQEITQYLQRLDQTVNEYRNVLVLNQHLKPREDQQVISKAMGKLSQFKYNDLNCDEIDRIVQALKDKESRKQLSLSDQFERMQDKVLFDLHEIVSMKFSCLQSKSLNKYNETQHSYSKDTDKLSKGFAKEIDSSQISKKIQEIMKEEIQKIKPLINEQISKAKTNIVGNQQGPKKFTGIKQDQPSRQMPKGDNWNKIYGTFRENYRGQQKVSQKQHSFKEQPRYQRAYQEQSSSEEQFDDSSEDQEQDQSQCSYQHTQPLNRSQADRSQTQSMTTTYKQQKTLKPSRISHSQNKLGRFNCIVKVLAIVQKQMKFGGKICTRFIGGDKTGAALFMMEHSSLLEPGNNLLMEHIKWANFNHEKQGLFTDKTQISLHDQPIKFVGPFRLGESVTKICDEKAKQIQVLIGKQHARMNKMKKQPQTKYVPKNKPEESKTNTRVQQEKKPQSQKQFPPQVNPRTQPTTSQNNQKPTLPTQQSPQIPPIPPIGKKIKISQITPKQTGCWITGQVLKVISSNIQKKIFLLGDETGVVNCEIQRAGNGQVKQGVYVYLQSFNPNLVDGFVLMRQSAKGNILLWNQAPPSINQKNKISEKIFL